ncbi:hypothetical protein B0A49_09159 [Cryomyces minteri]|uniref:Uncharacterized protein n=1 Tax=Cryomyces minteri TaxID=331657 RepID=A0A4U0WGC6_9PEZI|nr:hypothetical protein B0A49_09159 [Cryomyces minteri]
MVLEYFTFARAKKNKEALEKTNPQTPVLKDEDEQFLSKITSEEAAPSLPSRPTVISGDGKEKEVKSEDLPAEAAAGATQVPPPETAADDDSREETKTEGEEQAQQKSNEENKAEALESDKIPQSKGEEEGEEDNVEEEPKADTEAKTASKEPEEEPADDPPEVAAGDEGSESKDAGTSEGQTTSKDAGGHKQKRTWASYIPNVPAMPNLPAMPALPSMPSIPGRGSSKEKDANNTADSLASAAAAVKAGEGVELNEDGSLHKDEKAKKENEEVSVILDKLNLSAINNRVFSFSKESQEIYEKFTVVLKDIVNGAPTAYDDLEKLLNNSSGELDRMFGNMPPFVKTLVKSLPAKMTSSIGPDLLAMASEKPSLKVSEADVASAAAAPAAESSKDGKKKKSRIPSLKSLVSEQGAAASMLKSILGYLKMRFPAFISGTNVLMSLAVFILLFVFWYCHKRGKEVRLARTSGGEKGSASESEADESTVLEKPEREEEPGSGAAVAEPVESESLPPATVHKSEESAEAEDDGEEEEEADDAEAGAEADPATLKEMPDPAAVTMPVTDEDKEAESANTATA